MQSVVSKAGSIVALSWFWSICPTTTTAETIIYFNPRRRLLCGHLIPPTATLPVDQRCHEPARLWPSFPVSTAVVTTTRDGPLKALNKAYRRCRKYTDCDIPCHSAGNPSLVATRTVDGTDWTIHLFHGRSQMLRQPPDSSPSVPTTPFYSTRRQSDVPLRLQSGRIHHIQQPAVDYDGAIKAGVFFWPGVAATATTEAVISFCRNPISH
jgi:hypothetical protein